MPKFSKKIRNTLIVFSLVPLMSSCTNTVTSVTTTGCTAFGLIYPSRADTLETKRQVLAHNLTYEDVCKNEVE